MSKLEATKVLVNYDFEVLDVDHHLGLCEPKLHRRDQGDARSSVSRTLCLRPTQKRVAKCVDHCNAGWSLGEG